MRRKNNNHYLEREISWMHFNYRVLQEAQDKTVPLLERMFFLGIYSNNLDEFFRVRVAILNRIIALKETSFRSEKKVASETLKQIDKLYKKYALEFEETFIALKKELENSGIYILNKEQITEEQQKEILQIFTEKLSLYLYPRLFVKDSDFRGINDESVYLAIRILMDSGKKEYALLEVPTDILGRFIELKSEKNGKRIFLFIDDVIRICLPSIFVGQGFSQFEAYAFKLTKDAEMDIDIKLDDTLQKISKAVKNRKWGQPVRFVHDKSMPADLLRQIRKTFNIQKTDNVISGGRYHNLKDLISFPASGEGLKYPQWPALRVSEVMDSRSVMEVIKKQDLLLHYPYHSFSNYIRLLREAAISKEVSSIKITLYRLAKNSSVAEALICAAKNKKKVTVVIELLARFDEAANIYWTKKMRDAGINVILGIEGLKIHSKLTLIKGRRTHNIVCINTGNFHEGNARTYTDLTLMTANKDIVKEVEDVFMFIKKPYIKHNFKHLLVSPLNLRSSITALINTEIRNAQKGHPAYIKCKLNHITDKDIIEKLYQASAAGVKIELLVRGSCSIVTGMKGISSNITVKSIIDRYLEHSRIFIFCNKGNEKYYFGSADWIRRNFDSRVEVVVQALDERVKRELKTIVEYGLKDNQKARVVEGKGNNQITSKGTPFRSQEELYKYYKKIMLPV